MATENEFKAHPCSEKMKCLLGDHLKTTSGSLLFEDSAFLLFLSQSRHADLYLMNRQFTAVAQSLRINQALSPSSCTFIKRDRHFIFIYACKNQVTVLEFEGKDDGFEPAGEVCKTGYKFQGNDGFKVLSRPFKINEGKSMVAYSEKDEFYLISLSERGRKVSLEVVKLVDQQKSSGIWNWLTRQKPPHYQQVRIAPLSNQESNGLRILCVRDNTAAVYRIQEKQQAGKSTIKQIYACKSLETAISAESILLSVHLISEQLALLAYSWKGNLVLIKLSILEEENSMTVQKITTSVPSTNFQVLQCKQHLYFNVEDSQASKHKCFRFQLDLKELEKSFETAEPLFEASDPIWLCGNNKQLFLINKHNAYQIEEGSDEAGIPEQVKKYQSFEGWIERTINKKIKKHTQLRNYLDVETLLDEKQAKFIEELNHLKKGGLQATLQAKISQSIICTYIVKIILSKKEYFESLMEHPNLESKLRSMQQESLIQNLLINQSPVQIECMLRLMVQMQMIEYLNETLEEVSKHALRETCRETINQIFSDVCSHTIHSFKATKISRNISEHKILMEFTFSLINVDEGTFAEDFLYLVNEWSEDEVRFARNLVLNAKLISIFMHLFIRSSKVGFTTEEVKQMVSNLSVVERQAYLSQFFQRFREAYESCDSDSPKKDSMTKKGAVLVKGLAKYANQIEGILQCNFPGLIAYLYLNSEHRKEYKEELMDTAQKCSNPAAAFMLVLAAPSDNKKQWKQALAKIRLCQDLSLSYDHQGDVLKDLQDGKHQKRPINQKRWENHVHTLEISQERARKLAENLIIVP